MENPWFPLDFPTQNHPPQPPPGEAIPVAGRLRRAMAAVVQSDAAQTRSGHGLQAVHVEPGRNCKNLGCQIVGS